jgi:hypothetical protein
MLSGKPVSAFSASASDWAEFLTARQASLYGKHKARKSDENVTVSGE